MQKIELLAPAKNAEHGRIAVDFGADALYIGGAHFGARYAATNSSEDIAKLVEYAKAYNVKVYATLNTLIMEDELAQAEQTAKELIEAGVSALIVQDMSLMRMGLEGVEFHASTQTYNAHSSKVNFLGEAGFSRVILERGLSFTQIQKICAKANCEIECFIHGAICVGNSGECYLSRSQGARSGNRGECSQPCRLSYDLLDNEGNKVVTGKHLLSVKDMNFTPRLEQLINAGVTSLKIEGRLKDSNYVKNVVGHYRKTLDNIFERSAGKYCRSSEGETIMDFKPDTARSFTRGGSLYFLEGKNGLVGTHDTPKAIGQHIGTVAKMGEDWFIVKDGRGNLLSPGDGICIMSNGSSEGTNINKVADGRIFPNKMDSVVIGGVVYRNYDHKFIQSLERSRTRRVINVAAAVETTPEAISLTVSDNYGTQATATLEDKFDVASNPEKMTETLQSQISKSGDTIFAITRVKIKSEGDIPFTPASQLNALRRDALEQLHAKRVERLVELNLRSENVEAKYPLTHLGGDGNVTNSVAHQFYVDHGVEHIDESYELRDELRGEIVMTTPYCIRRELGQCLIKKHTLKDDLHLTRGKQCYLLSFDCKRCTMTLIKEN